MNYFEYFSEIEERFTKRRGSLLLLSTLDWALIETWREAGVPLEAVLRGIDDAFDKYEARNARAKGKLRKVNGLAWCAQAVMQATEDMAEAATGSAGAQAAREVKESGFEAERVAQYLEANAVAIAAAELELSGADHLREETALADAKWLGAMAYFHDLTYVCAPSALQHGVAQGLEQLGNEFYTQLASDHYDKRARIVAALNDAGMKPYVPAGAYYILADASHLPGESAAKKARALLAKTGVAAVAGSAFFRTGHGENLLRFCFAKKDRDLDDACERLRSLRHA